MVYSQYLNYGGRAADVITITSTQPDWTTGKSVVLLFQLYLNTKIKLVEQIIHPLLKHCYIQLSYSQSVGSFLNLSIWNLCLLKPSVQYSSPTLKNYFFDSLKVHFYWKWISELKILSTKKCRQNTKQSAALWL